MTFTTSSIPDLSGRVAVVTGANGGLGLEIARGLASAGAAVVIAARNQEKAQLALADIELDHPDATLEIVELDLASLASVAAAAETIAANHPEIDILVNNAGLMAMPEMQTDDGFEMQFGVNHLGHWALTAQLMPNLLAAPAARVVAQSSIARLGGAPVAVDNPHLRGNYSAWRAYNQSKLANYHFALGLQQQFDNAGVAAASLVAHPGMTNTDLQRNTESHGGGGVLGRISVAWASATGMTPAQGALSALRAATDPKAKGGDFFGPRFMTFGPPAKLPTVRPGSAQSIARLWEVSERETGLAINVE